MKLLKTLLLPALWVVAFAANAQDNIKTAGGDSTKTDKKTVVNASVNYVSRLNYFGRVDSLNSSGLFPILGVESKIGLYANASFIFTQNSVQSLKYAGTSIEGGYKFPESKNFSGNVFYTQFLYTNSTAIVQSALKSQTGLNLTWKNKYINITGGGDLKFSDNTDIGLTGTIDHFFIFKIQSMVKTAVAVNPTATVNAGTQKFIQSWSNKVGGILGNLPGAGGNNITTQSVNRFNILSYEFSIPVVFVSHQFYIALTPAYVIPQNLITITNRPDLSENGKNLFYVTATAGMRLQFR
jgi:hypothetical protein